VYKSVNKNTSQSIKRCVMKIIELEMLKKNSLGATTPIGCCILQPSSGL